MNFLTPFHVNNGRILDRNYDPIILHPVRFRLTDDRKEAFDFLAQCRKNNVDLICVEFTESLLTEKNGALKEGPALDLVDDFLEETFQAGIYLVFTPITEKIRIPDGRSENAIREDEPIYAERYFDALFRHVNRNSSKMFYEYENLAGIEYLLAWETFSRARLYAYIHHMGCFVQHFFLDRLLELCFLDRGTISEELRGLISTYPQFHIVDWFPNPEKIRIPKDLAGLHPVGFAAFVREKGVPNFLPCPAARAASKSLHTTAPHGNGGEEGFITLEADCAMEFMVEFPCKVESAQFRPSLREKIAVSCEENKVFFTLPRSKYGVLEINYKSENLPHFTVYVLMDPIIAPPADDGDVTYLDGGTHKMEELVKAGKLYFREGVHFFDEERLVVCSGQEVYLAPGAVLKCGLRCEEGENIRVCGSGIFDGTLTQRKPGENWKGRADDAFVHFFKGKNIVWDGPMIFNSPFWNMVPEGTAGMTIRHHKAITWAVNSDGIQPRSCIDLLVEDSFFKCSDDSIAIKTRRASGMHSHHITVRNIVTWNDAGSSLEIGHTSQADLLEDVTFENVEIIRAVGGKCHIYLIDHSTVRNILYKNIFIEGESHNAGDISFCISQNFYSTDDTRASISHIRIEDLHVEDSFSGVCLKGFDEEHRIEDVVLKGLYIHKDGVVESYQGDLADLAPQTYEFASPIVFERKK